jgi:hypothetical protein
MRTGAARVGVRRFRTRKLLTSGGKLRGASAGAPPLQSAKFSFHSWVASAGGASGLKKAESWMCEVVT